MYKHVQNFMDSKILFTEINLASEKDTQQAIIT